MLKVGVFGTSKKVGEKRVPIHPEQLAWIDEEIRQHLIFENDYGIPFGVSNEQISSLTGGMVKRKELFQLCDIALLPKPVQSDFDSMKEHGILWGWPHCVQQRGLTQTAIDKKLSLIAWEAMHRWGPNGGWQMHIFHKNNEMAGYAGILHAFNLAGIDGNYGPSRKAIVISFGSVSRGAIHALQARGIRDITVITKRQATLVSDQIMGINHYHYEDDEFGNLLAIHPDSNSTKPLIDLLADTDIIVNGILQDTDHPLLFVREDQIARLKPGCLIIDISCDEGMGFSFARPTAFSNPMLKVEQLLYYAVDHTPSYLWNGASWEISNSLLPYLPLVMQGPERWKESETLRRAIEIQDGVIQNPKILSFQKRAKEYPHSMVF